ncbi:MAG: glucose 1-dehydrogenase [Gammaproteobacteria bacterium]|nr:MAG: glucose 1-dehydrogenase [Gammaproteobacteria bacterium]
MSLLDRFRLTNKVALVTGGSRGIGLAIAQGFADAGADVVIAARDKDVLAKAEAQLKQAGTRVLALSCNASRESDLQALVDQTLATFGRLDILVNNAGGAYPNDMLKTSTEQFEKDFHFNVGAPFTLSRLCAPALKQHQGCIINITSAAARYSQKGFTSYGTAKAGLTHLTHLMAADLAPDIRVNGIAPGSIMTDALAQFIQGEAKEKMIALTPMKALGYPEDIAAAALYLASPASQWVTGKILEIDGGADVTTWPF